MTTVTGLHVVVLIGTGDHADPWHDLRATGGRVAELLGSAGATAAVVTSDDPDALAVALRGADVLVVNASGDPEAPDPVSAPLVDAIAAHSAAGGGIVALHSSTLAFRDDPRWRELLGGRWVAGVSGHPPIGAAEVRALAAPGAGPSVLGALVPGDFVVFDERYSDLERSETATTLAVHEEGGDVHPLVWVVEGGPERGPVAYDALGHGVESYDSDEHRALVTRLVAWAAPDAPPTTA